MRSRVPFRLQASHFEALNLDPSVNYFDDIFDFNKDDDSLPQPHWKPMDVPYSVLEIPVEGMDAPLECPVPGPAGQMYTPGAGGASASGSAPAAAIVPRQFALKYMPPTIMMLYDETDGEKDVVKRFDMAWMDARMTPADLANELYMREPTFFNKTVVRHAQVERLVQRLLDNWPDDEE